MSDQPQSPEARLRAIEFIKQCVASFPLPRDLEVQQALSEIYQLLAASARLSAPPADLQWQPITTAPWQKEILVCSGHYVSVAIHRRAGNGFPARWSGSDPDAWTFSSPEWWTSMPRPHASLPAQEEPKQ